MSLYDRIVEGYSFGGNQEKYSYRGTSVVRRDSKTGRKVVTVTKPKMGVVYETDGNNDANIFAFAAAHLGDERKIREMMKKADKSPAAYRSYASKQIDVDDIEDEWEKVAT